MGKLVYPHPSTWHGPAPPRSDLHVTAGIPHNWALDFMCMGGTRFIAPEACTITRLSGHNPAEGEVAPGIYGWNIYLTTSSGIEYFATHLENRIDELLNHRVTAGCILGHSGHWPHDPGRSHLHMGVTHPGGEQAAKDHICAVASAARVRGHWPNV
jgi:hypothetical protein